MLIACAIVLFLILARPIPSGQVYSFDDLANFQLPYRHHYSQALSSGESFLWSPLTFNGFDIHAEGEAGMTHPAHLALYRLLPLPLAFNLEMLANYVLLYFGTFFFLRRLRLPRDAALAGALMFAFGGFGMVHYVHLNHVAGVAHIPWLLLALDRALTGDRRRLAGSFLLLALVTASQLLVSHPQYVIYSLMAEGAFVLLRFRPAPWSRLGVVVGAKLLGAGVAAVQWMPTLAWIPKSSRAVAEDGFSLAGSVHPANLLQFVAPYGLDKRVYGDSPWEFAIYLAGAVPALLAWLWIRRRSLSAWRPLLLPVALFSLLMLLLALGRYGGIGQILLELPGLDRFRVPARHILLCQLGLTLLASIGVADLLEFTRRDERLSWRRLVPLALLASVSAVACVVLLALGRSDHAWSEHVAGVAPVGIGALLVVGAAVAAIAVARGVRGAAVVLLVVACLDVVLWGAWFPLRWDETRTVAQIVEAVPAPPGEASTRIHVPVKYGYIANRLSMEGHRSSTGFTGLYPSRLVPADSTAGLRASGVHWTLDIETGVYSAVSDPLEPYRLVSSALVSESPAEDIERIDLETTALTDRPLELTPGEPGRVESIERTNARIEIDLETPGRQLLVTTESYHDGWTARVDGQPVDLVRVNGDWLGCVVEPGRRTVVLQFEPAGFRTGLRASLVSLFLVFATGMWLRRSGR